MKQKIKISHLVTNGCSFTYCSGLENVKEQGWPALVAKKLQVPIVNLAIRGSGNDGIFRRTYEYFFLNQPYNNHPFFINAWSFAGRREEFFVEFNDIYINDIITFTIHGDTDFEKMMLKNLLTDEGMLFAERKKLLYWAACIQLFKNNNLPYLTSAFIPVQEKFLKKLKNLYPDQYKLVYEDNNRLENFNAIAEGYDKVLSGHFGPIAQQVLADYIFNCLLERYDFEIVPATNGFVDLETYFTNPIPMHEQNLWRNR